MQGLVLALFVVGVLALIQHLVWPTSSTTREEDPGSSENQQLPKDEEGILSNDLLQEELEHISCLILPDAQQTCPSGYVLNEEECCSIAAEEGGGPSGVASLASSLAIEVAVGEAAEFVMKRSAKKITAKGAQKVLGTAGKEVLERTTKEAAEKAGKEALKAGHKVGSKAYKKAVSEATHKATKQVMKELTEKTVQRTVQEATSKAAQEATEQGLKSGTKAHAKVVSEATERAMRSLVKEIGEKASMQATTRVGTRVTTKTVTQTSSRAAQKVAARIASKVAVKLGVGMARAAAKAATGIGAVLMIFDVVSMGLDLADPEGYNNFTENAIVQTAIASSEYDMEQNAARDGRDWPMCFPMDTSFPKEWRDSVVPALQTTYRARAFDALPENVTDRLIELESADDPEAAIADAIRVSWEPDLPPEGAQYPKDVEVALDHAFVSVMNADPVERDEVVFEAFRRSSTFDPTHVAFYPSMSTKDRIGVGLSEAGVTAWNQRHKETWFKYYDIFDHAEVPPDDFIEPVVAIFVNAYRSLDQDDPGTDESPNMKARIVPMLADTTEFEAIGGPPLTTLPSSLRQPTNSDDVSDVVSKLTLGQTKGLPSTTKRLWTTEEYVQVGSSFFRPKRAKLLGNNWRRVPVDKDTKRPLRGQEVFNRALRRKLSQGMTSFTLAETKAFGLPTNMTTDSFVLVGGDKAYSPTHHVSLFLRGGHIVSFCERPRNAKFLGGLISDDLDDSNAGVDPRTEGVRFHDGTFSERMTATVEKVDDPIPNPVQCVYTDKFCTRMGMKHQYDFYKNTSDCWMDGGQGTSEMLFGTTITRGIARGMHDALGFQCNDPVCEETEYCEARTCHPKQGVGAKVGPAAGWKCLSGKEIFGTCHNGPRSLDVGAEVGFHSVTGGATFCKTMAEDFGKCAVCTGLGGVGNKFCDIANEGRTWTRVDWSDGWTMGREWIHTGLSEALPTQQQFTKEEWEAFDFFKDVKESEDWGKEQTMLQENDYVMGVDGILYRPVLHTSYCEHGSCHQKHVLGHNVGWTAGWKCKSGMEVNGRCHEGQGSLPVGTDVAWGNGRFCISGKESGGKCVECQTVDHCGPGQRCEHETCVGGCVEAYVVDDECSQVPPSVGTTYVFGIPLTDGIPIQADGTDGLELGVTPEECVVAAQRGNFPRVTHRNKYHYEHPDSCLAFRSTAFQMGPRDDIHVTYDVEEFTRNQKAAVQNLTKGVTTVSSFVSQGGLGGLLARTFVKPE